MVAIVCLRLIILIKIAYLSIIVKLWLVIGMTKETSDGKDVDYRYANPRSSYETHCFRLV